MVERRHARPRPQHPLVLIVDGHDDTRELYSLALQSLGFETKSVGDVEDVYARAWETHPDVIATEIAAAADPGWNFMQDLKRDPRTRDIPVVVVTSHGQVTVRERAAREGCAAFLLKPCAPDDLAATLRSVLNRPDDDPVGRTDRS
jgi:CheY-like chemotaxis protein